MKPHCGMFAGRVWHGLRQRHHASGRGQGDDVATVAFDHVRQEGLGGPEQGHGIDGHDAFDDAGIFVDQALLAGNAGIVDQDVDAAFRHGRLEHFGSICDIDGSHPEVAR